MHLLQRSPFRLLRPFFGRDRSEAAALYDAVVARGRAPRWYEDGGVADTIDGRFDMIAAVLAMVLLRLEAAQESATLSARLTERFIDDMDGPLRQIGIGDVVVGKHLGKLVRALGGRLGAYRDGLAAGDLAPALVRNLYRGETPDPAALAYVSEALSEFRTRLDSLSLAALEQGRLPE